MSSTGQSDKSLGMLLAAYYYQKARIRLDSRPKIVRLALLAIFTFSLVSGTYGAKAWQKRKHQEQARRKALLHRNSRLLSPDGSRTLFVPNHTSTAKIIVFPTKPTTFDAHRRLFLNLPRTVRLSNSVISSEALQPQTKPGLNIQFLHQFLSLWNIMVPRWNSKESGLLFSQSVFLMLRTYLSLVVARLDGEIVRDLVAGNGKAFGLGILKWLSIGGVSIISGWVMNIWTNKCRVCLLCQCRNKISTK